ncbi:MAG: hypothetical protein U0R80_15220 [Nocardioidaceae bacterium]
MRRTVTASSLVLAFGLSSLTVLAASSSLGAAPAARPDATGARHHAKAPTIHTVGGCEVFPADNPWNTRVDGAPVAANSAKIVARQAAGNQIHLDLGSTEEYYGIPVNVVPQDQALLPLRFGVEGENYADESDKGPFPISQQAHIEGWRTSRPNPKSGDRHVIVVRQGTCDLTELYKAKRIRNDQGEVVGWRASSAAHWDLSSNALRPAGWTSADAAGLPIMPGLLDYDEAASGEITHALRFTLPVARNAYTKPARHCGNTTGKTLPAYGMRFRLKASFPASRYTGAAKAIVVAMKRYGLMYADQGSAMYVTGTSDPRWADAIDQFREKPLDGSKFEVVDPGRIHICRG